MTSRTFTIERQLAALPATVFRAWTDPEHLGWFFNPDYPTDIPIEIDLRVGGSWRQHMVIDADTHYVTGGVYLEIVPGEKLVFTWGADGGWPALDAEAPTATVLFEANDGGTLQIFRINLPGSLTDERARELLATGMREGWDQTISRLVVEFRDAEAALP